MQWCMARGAIGAAGGRCKLQIQIQIQIQIQSALCLPGRQERARVQAARLCGQSAWAKRVSEQRFMATGAQRNTEKHGKAERACSRGGVMAVAALPCLRVQRLPLCCGLGACSKSFHVCASATKSLVTGCLARRLAAAKGSVCRVANACWAGSPFGFRVSSFAPCSYCRCKARHTTWRL